MGTHLAIIGLGYVGLPLALQFARCGQQVLGFDIDEEKVAQLNAGQSYLHHIPSTTVQELVEAGRLQASSDFARVKEAAAILICVPTPLTLRREPDLSFILRRPRRLLRIWPPGY
jgi:UDP-N-acetyl-D-glucosamine dehydrogenase